MRKSKHVCRVETFCASCGTAMDDPDRGEDWGAECPVCEDCADCCDGDLVDDDECECGCECGTSSDDGEDDLMSCNKRSRELWRFFDSLSEAEMDAFVRDYKEYTRKLEENIGS